MARLKLFLFWLLRKYRSHRVLSRVKSHHNEIFIGGIAATRLTKNTTLGRNPNFNGMTILGSGEVRFGDNFHSGGECLIITSNHNYEGARIPYDDSHIVKKVIIEDNVWFGNRVIVLGGVTIGEGAIIQAGAVVIKDIPPGGIAGGNPAKVFKYRDMDHYFNLKAKELFH